MLQACAKFEWKAPRNTSVHSKLRPWAELTFATPHHSVTTRARGSSIWALLDTLSVFRRTDVFSVCLCFFFLFVFLTDEFKVVQGGNIPEAGIISMSSKTVASCLLLGGGSNPLICVILSLLHNHCFDLFISGPAWQREMTPPPPKIRVFGGLLCPSKTLLFIIHLFPV